MVYLPSKVRQRNIANDSCHHAVKIISLMSLFQRLARHDLHRAEHFSRSMLIRVRPWLHRNTVWAFQTTTQNAPMSFMLNPVMFSITFLSHPSRDRQRVCQPVWHRWKIRSIKNAFRTTVRSFRCENCNLRISHSSQTNSPRRNRNEYVWTVVNIFINSWQMMINFTVDSGMSVPVNNVRRSNGLFDPPISNPLINNSSSKTELPKSIQRTSFQGISTNLCQRCDEHPWMLSTRSNRTLSRNSKFMPSLVCLSTVWI